MENKNQFRNVLLWIFGLPLVCTILWLALWTFPKFQVRNLHSKKITADRIVEIEDKARATSAQIIGGALVFLSAFVAWKNMVNTKEAQEKQHENTIASLNITKEAQEKQFENTIASLNNTKKAQETQFEIALSGQVTDRFLRAVELLNANDNENIVKRLGGIYSLERIALDSHSDQRPVMSVLTAYIRTKSPLDTKPYTDNISLDIQDALMAISRINEHITINHGKHIMIDLRNTHLSKANLYEADLSKALLHRTNLYNATPIAANLRKAVLYLAILTNANLQFAQLDGADFGKANLINADLRNTDLRNVIGLTQEQLDSAITDETTKVSPPLKIKSQTQEPSSQPVNNI